MNNNQLPAYNINQEYSEKSPNPPPINSFVKSSNDVLFPPNLVEMLSEPTLILEREMELLELTLGFDQANKYKIFNSQGRLLGHMYEKSSLGQDLTRQCLGNNRPFKVMITNLQGELLLEIKRSFTVINSTCIIRMPYRNRDNQLVTQEIGRSEQIFNPFKRKYKLSTINQTNSQLIQFGNINTRILGRNFPVQNDHGLVIGGIDKSWTGIMRELFTESPMFVVRFQNCVEKHYTGPALDLNQRAVLLACAISIDIDYFNHQ